LGLRVYLDMDGVILRSVGASVWNCGWEIADGALDFLTWAVERFDVAWLTARCRDGDMRHIERGIRHAIPAKTLPSEWRVILDRTTAAAWSRLKTDAIDLADEFAWIDDAPQSEALLVLESRGLADRWIECNTDIRPDDLRRIRDLLTSRFPVAA
jgi:hypothetical protein